MAEKRVIDWDDMYPHWCAGIITLSNLSRQYGVSRPAIEKHWDKLGVPRDLTAKIKAKADSMSVMRDDWRNGIVSLSDMSRKYNITIPAIKKYWGDLGIERIVVERSVNNCGVKLIEKDDFDCSGFIYVIYIDTGLERIYKIGLAKHFSSRFNQHQCSSPFDIFVSIAYFVENMRLEERTLHNMFDDKRVRGEWFKLNSDDLIEIAKRSYIGG